MAIIMGAPTSNPDRPIVIDISTSGVAIGKVQAYRRENKQMPEGWANDYDGVPTTDPHKAYVVRPMGDHKGYGLATFVDLFGGCLSLSGLFHAGYFFGDYTDMDVYYNSPTDFMRNMPADHPLVEKYRQGRIIICCGQGAWEDELKASTGRLAKVLHDKGINIRVEFWGHDVNHDWDWWYKQVPVHLPNIL